MNLEYIDYKRLNNRQKERYNFHKVSSILVDYGYSCIKLDDDWEGADFIAQHFINKSFLSVQLKGRLTFARKYCNKKICIAFPYKEEWYLYDHDKLLEKFLTEFKDSMALSTSWLTDKFYTWNSLSKQIKSLLAPYKLKQVKQVMDTN